nr:hypothetical protein [Tanacetum cinerariifolium]
MATTHSIVLSGKENGVNILKLIDEGPFKLGMFRETLAEGEEGALPLHPERPRHKRETIHDYYVRFAKLINDMWNIKMTMSRMQLNFKFVNNMLPEWGRFVTTVKLNRGLRDSNYYQLYVYLKQHETHANENKMMLDRFTQNTIDPFALMSNVSHQQYYLQSSTTPPSISVQPYFADNTQLDLGLSPTDNLIENLTNTLALLTQSYKTYIPQKNNQLRTSSNTRNQATVQDGRVVVLNVQGHIARNCTQPKRPQNSEYFKDKMLLMQAQENGVELDEEQLLFIVGGQDNAVDEDVDKQPVQDLALNVDNVFQVDDCDAFDFDVDEAPTAQTMFMENLSFADPVYDEAGPSYDSDILSEYVKDNAVLVVQISKFSDMHEALSAAQKRIAELESENFNLQNKIQNDDHDVMELYDSIKIKRAKTIEKTNSLLIEVANLKAQIQENHISNCVIMPAVKSKVLALGRYAIDIELIPISIRNNWEVHLDYLKHLKESVETLHEIVEEAKVERPLDRLLAFACLYTKHSQELLEYLIGTFPRTPQWNGVVKRQNHTLVEASRTMLIFSKASMFLWAEAVATSCYTKNRSLIHTRYNKPPYELVHPKNPGLTFFRVFGELYYPTNDSEDFGKLQPIADIGIFVGYAPSWKGPGPAFLTPRQISSGLVPNPVPAAPYVPPTNKDLEILFLPMFEEYLETPCVERPGFPALAVPVPVNTVGTPSSTTIDQDAPCPSHSPSSLAFQSPSLLQGVAAESTIMEVNPFTPVDNDPFVNVFAPKPSSEASSSGDVSSAASTYVTHTHHYLRK